MIASAHCTDALISLSVLGLPSGPAKRSSLFYNNRFQQAEMYALDSKSSYIAQYCYDFHVQGGATIGDLNFECDFTATSPANNANLYQVMNNLDGNRTQNFVYDSLNRIQAASTSGPKFGEAYTIDAWGNLTAINSYQGKPYEGLNCGPANSKNQLNTCYGYDAAGNLKQNGSQLYTYDAENRLITAGGVTYTYDGDGKRVMKSNGTIYWRGLGDDVLAESNLSGTISEEYAYLDGKRMVRMDRPGGTPHVYFTDLVGSATMITDINGNLEKQSDYYPYGGEIPVSGTDPNHYKFTGKERDSESGLDEFGARYYGSSLGRFMQPDWAAAPTAVPYAHYGNPQSLNLYAYVENNPTTTGDPDGHSDAGTFCSAECRARYAQYAAEHPVAATLEPIAEFGTIPTAMFGGAAAWGSALFRNLLGLGLATAPTTVPLINEALEGLTPGQNATLGRAGALGVSSIEKLGESGFVGSLENGARISAGFEKVGDALGVNISNNDR